MMGRLGGGGDSTKPSQRVTKTIEELQMWKRHLVLTDKQFKGYVASTEHLAGMLNETVKAFPRVYEHTALNQNEATLGTAWAALPGPRDKMQGRPGADTMKRLTDTLSRDVHVPINQWHKRYGELKESVVKELDVARKHYDAASQDLNKTKKKQQLEEKKQHVTTVEALQTLVQEKLRARQESWNAYYEKECQVYNAASLLARDAHQVRCTGSGGDGQRAPSAPARFRDAEKARVFTAYNWLSKATSALSMAMAEMAHRFAAGSNGQFAVPTPPQLPMQQLSIEDSPVRPPPQRAPSWTGSQSRVAYGTPVAAHSPGTAGPAAHGAVPSGADSARCSEFQQQKGGASEARYQPQASSNSSGSAKYQPQSSNASGASMAHPRYGDDDGEYGDEGAARAAPGKEAGPPTKAPGHARTGSGGIASAAAHKGKGGDGNGYVAIGTYGTPSTGAAARAPAWHQAPRPPAPSKGSASSTAGYTSPTGYTLPENLSTRQGNRHAPSKSPDSVGGGRGRAAPVVQGASDISLSAAAGGAPSPGNLRRNSSSVTSPSGGATRVALPHTPASVDDSFEEEETPMAERNYASPFKRTFPH